MASDWVATREVRFGGFEGALTILLGGSPGGSLISREMPLEFGPLTASVCTWFDFDPEETRAALDKLLDRPDLTGSIPLTGSEHGELAADVDLRLGRGTLTIRMEPDGGLLDGHTLFAITTDHTFLAAALRALREVA